MYSGSQIDNVQSFVELIGNNDNLWNFLVGREVINFWGMRGRIVLLCDRGKGSQIRVDLPITVRDSAGARDCLRCKFFRIEEFISEFNKIDPPFCYEEILQLMQAKNLERERYKTEIRKEEKRKLEKEEAKRKEIARRRVEKQALLMSLKEQQERTRNR
ncbi:hypothetical protein [Nostoc sp.]|uniref:hypothetical protein n=1 Tax=Nostoc sp. TaxID=1180 RepID=UPI002FFA5FF3